MNQWCQSVRQALILMGCICLPLSAAAEPSGAQVTRPPGYRPLAGDVGRGEKLFSNPKLSTNGQSCATCHANHANFSVSFAQPYPHRVAMAKDQLGMTTVHLDEMVQACIVMPMAAKPLPWNSHELADLTAYVMQLQKTFHPAK